MFQLSHFQKMAKELGVDSVTYEKEYNGFMAKLKNFHESKGTPFRRLPWLGGQFLDLYLLYRKVTSSGGWLKVTEDKKWRDIAEVFNLPPTCTNAAFALRQHYSRYLESFERINFFGEDAEDVLAAGRPHTPVGGGITATNIASDYISVISTSKDSTRNFDKLVLSLQCGMPNEVDFAINICMLLSNVSNSVFNLSKAPAVVDTLLAHVGVFSEDSHGLKGLYNEWYIKQDVKRDFIKFWRESLAVVNICDILYGREGNKTTSEEPLFHPSRPRIGGARDVECQRVAQVCMILYNFSFDVVNASVLASHPLCLRFLVLCICSDHGFLQRMAWETLSNLAEKMLMEPIESTDTQMFFQMLHIFLGHKDRHHLMNAMRVLGKLCALEGNDDVIEAGLEQEAYELLIRVLIISDVQLVISSLESLYNLSGVGQVTSDHIAEVHHSIDILVCLVTMDTESFGPEALSEVRIVENRVAATVPVTPKPQPTPTPVVSQQHKEPVQQPPQGSHSSPSPSPGPSQAPTPPPAPAPTPPPTAVKTTGTEIDPETFTFNWLQGTYEYSPGSSVSRIDIYADYLSSCSRLARVGILNATAFNRIIKLAFPDGQLKRAQSGTQVQYVLAGLKRRSNPLPVKSRTDAPLHQSSTPAAGQRVLPTPAVSVQQSFGRTPASSTSPVWNPTKQQNIAPSQQPLALSVSRPLHQRPVQGPVVGGVQVGGNPQQATPGKVQLPRRPNMPGGNQPATAQVVRQFPEVGMQQLTAQSSLVAQRQTAAVTVQRTMSPLAQGSRPLERLQSQQRASVEGTIISQQANPQSFQQHLNQAQHVPQLQRIPVPVKSSGLQRPITSQQGTNPAQPQQVPFSPSQRIGSNSFPPQFAAKPPLTPTHGLQESIHPSQNPLPRSPLQPHSPKYPTTSRPVNTPPPTGTVQRPSPAVPPAYRPAPPYQQLPTMLTQQQVRQTSLGLNGRSYGSYPPLAPKPSQGVNVQGFAQHGQLVSHAPVNPGAPGQYAGLPQLPRSSSEQPGATLRPNFKSHGVASNIQPLSTLSSSYAGGPLAVGPLNVLPSELVGTNSRPINGPDVRQARSDSISSSRSDGVVLIAQEERAADVVSTGLLDGAEEQQILVVENRNRTELQTKAQVTAVSQSSKDVHSLSRSSAENICSSRQNIVPNPPRMVALASSNGSLKRNFDVQTSEPNKIYVFREEGQNGQRDRESENCGPPKRPRLEDRLPSLDNDLEHSTTLPSRTGSPSSLLNGDIKGDPRNKLMDKLLDKDLHIPLNGVCGIDSSELDLMASDGERLSSSKASSPDLFGSETNSDFGKYLEESDTDTGLFSDLLQGDLQFDPMENGTDSQHSLDETKLDSKSLNMPPFQEGAFGESGSTLIEKGNVPALAVQDKVPIPPVSGLDTQNMHGQNITPTNRYPATINPSDRIAVDYGNTVALKPTFPQNFGNEIHHKVTPYQQQRKLSPSLDNKTQAENVSLEIQGRTRTSGSTVVMQKNAFPMPTIPSNSQQMVAGQGASKMLASGIPHTILSRNYQTTVANTMSSGTQGLNVSHPLVTAPTSQSNAKPVLISQTPVLGGQAISVTQNTNLIPGMQHSDGSPVVVHRPQQINAVHYSGPRIQAGTPQTSSSGVGLPSMGATPAIPPHPSLPQQHPPIVYNDIRTRSMVTPDSSVFEATTVSKGRQPSASLPSQQQQVPTAPTGKGLEQSTMGTLPRSEDVIPTPSPVGNSTDVVVPQVNSFRPYRCRWAKCSSSFDSSKGLFAHVVSEHVPRHSLVMSCMWEGCQPVRRSRSSLLFHLQQKHSEPTPVSSTPPLQVPAQHQTSHVQHPPQPQAPPANPPTSYVPAYHFLARMLQSLQGDEEPPLTKTVRLTAALVLRNIAQYSALARSMLRRHEHHLSLVAMSNSEAAHAVAACLSELSPHRKTSCDSSEAFIWALDR